MHLHLFRHKRSVKIALSSFLCLSFIIHFYFNNTLTSKSPHFPWADGKLRGLITNSSVSKCPLGFYSKQELRPPLQRPFQDRMGPGAEGKPFVWRHMTAEEQKEESSGYKKNQFNQFASDHISLHRNLGKDTRPLEWVSLQLTMQAELNLILASPFRQEIDAFLKSCFLTSSLALTAAWSRSFWDVPAFQPPVWL